MPAAFGEAIRQVGQLIVSSGVLVDAIDIGGGFPSRYPHSEPPDLASFMDEVVRAADELAVKHSCELLCEPGRALVAEAESVIVRVDARRDNALYLNDGAFGTLFDAAYSGFRFPGAARHASRAAGLRRRRSSCSTVRPATARTICRGPSCCLHRVAEGDYLEIGQIGAYGRVLANRFNGFGVFDEVVLTDEPMLSMYESAEDETSQAAWPARA